MTTLVIVRHGQSVSNVAHLFAGHTDVELTDIGKEQAEFAAHYLHKHFHVDAIYSSDLRRAYETALPTARLFGLPVHKDTDLREIFAGEWEMQVYETLLTKYPTEFGSWAKDCSLIRCAGGESIPELYDRICAAVLRLAKKHDGETILIATHSTPVRVFTAMVKGYDRLHAGLISGPANASIHHYTVENGVARAVALNITEHLHILTEDLKPPEEN